MREDKDRSGVPLRARYQPQAKETHLTLRHRTVVLPEFQGFVVGASLSDAVGEWLRRLGSDFYGQTVLGDLPSRGSGLLQNTVHLRVPSTLAGERCVVSGGERRSPDFFCFSFGVFYPCGI